jgi:hypothetical protein
MKEFDIMKSSAQFLRGTGAALALLAAGPALANSITVYNDRAIFTAEVGGAPTVETFGPTAKFPISTGVLNSNTNLPGIGIAPGDILPGATYSTPIGVGNFFNIDSGGGFLGGMLNSLASSPLTVTFDGPVSGFGFDTNNLMGDNFQITINFLTSSPFFTSLPVFSTGDLEFFGFTSSSQDIVSAVIYSTSTGTPSSRGFSFILDDFTFTSPGVGPGTTVVPLPAPLLLLATGLFTLGVFGRRKAA